MRNLVWLAWIWALGGCASELEEEEDDSCDKVDILFVVDNSGSMGDNQKNLVDNFPKFAQSIQSTLGPEIDYHVGIVTSDDYAGNATGCQQLGALVTQTSGTESSGAVCGPFKEGRFLSRQDSLVPSFQCAARVGSSGSGMEDVIGAAASALAPGINASGACNAGFLREDSLLVLVLLTDEDTMTAGEQFRQMLTDAGLTEGASGGTLPELWKRRIAQESGHAPGNTVVVTLAKGVPGNVCRADEAGSDGAVLMQFTGQYKYNFLGDICAADYGDVLVKALAPVDNACKEYQVNREEAEEDEEGTCADEGPGTKDWLFSSLVLASTTLVVAWAGLQTLSRQLARSGHRQGPANMAGLGLGLLMGGILGSCVAVFRECGIFSAPGWLGMGVALVGLVLLLLGTLTGRPSR